MKKLLILLAVISVPAFGATFERISSDGGLGNLSFTQLAANNSGDFVATSNTKVFAGNLAEGQVEEILDAGGNTSFGISDWQTLTVDDQRVQISFGLYPERVAINTSGEFVLTSNRNLYFGNARTGEIDLVYQASRFSEFQQVAINNQGHYVATTHETIVSGSRDLTPRIQLEEAVGTFSVYDVWSGGSRVDVETGESRLVLDQTGRYVAIASSAVYVGSVGLDASLLYEQRYADFRHVKLTPNGFVVLSQKEVFAGSF